MYLFSKFSD